MTAIKSMADLNYTPRRLSYSQRAVSWTILPIFALAVPSNEAEAQRVVTETRVDICELASGARARNSPAIAGLEAQCAAETARAKQQADGLAIHGSVIGLKDPIIIAMRERYAQGDNAHAFDVGLAAAHGQTEWGPGKERLANSFNPAPRGAFRLAAEYTIDRNRNATRVATGAPIVQADPELAAARERHSDPRFGLGFDIATAIFGDPARGAQGNTELGPGSLGIRAALSELARQGFDAALKLHLARTYGG